MARHSRHDITDNQEAELWYRWRMGEPISSIGLAIGKARTSVSYILRRHGGFPPPVRKRSPVALTLAEREEISRVLSAGHSMRQIAKMLPRPPSTISREIARNGGQRHYRAVQADEKAWERTCRPKLCRLAQNGKLRQLVANKISLDRAEASQCQLSTLESGGSGTSYGVDPCGPVIVLEGHQFTGA